MSARRGVRGRHHARKKIILPRSGRATEVGYREEKENRGGWANRVWRFGGVAGADLAGRRGEREETGLPLLSPS